MEKTNNAKLALLVKIMATAFSGIYIYQAAFGVWEPQYSRGCYIFFALALAFLTSPNRKKGKEVPLWLHVMDVALAVVTLGCVLYFIGRYQYYAIHAGMPLGPVDLFMGILTLLLVLEACRRCIGLALPIIVAAFLVYCYVGRYMPGPLMHKGFSLNRIVNVMFAGTEGIFGSVVYTFSTYIFLFIIFGSFLQKSGAGQFFIDVAKAVAGRLAGGAAQAAVISSWIFGSIMGSSTANAAISGAVSIPLMIENGYKRHVAASIEAVVSIGGQFMPPIMGAAAFLMASMIGIPYSQVALAGLPSAILFFISMMLMVYLEAKSSGLKPLPETEIPKMSQVFKKGWIYLIPIAVIVFYLAIGASPAKAGFWSIVACVGVSWLTKDRRMGIKEILDALSEGAIGSLSMANTAGAIGILIAAISLPGLGMKISTIIMQISNGFLPLALLLVMAASFILGMGMNVSSAYLLLVTLTAPALTQLGVPLLTAHFFVFWTSQLAVVTPPVCLSAYVAAAIAGADIWKTGWSSLRMGLVIYYMPILFVYMPGLLLIGSTASILYAIFCTLIGVFAYAVVSQGFLILKLTWYERVIMGVAAVMTLLIGWMTDLIGILLIASVFALQLTRKKKEAALQRAV